MKRSDSRFGIFSDIFSNREKEQKYKVVKIFEKSGRRQVLRKNLLESEAQRVVKSYPDSKTHIVVYYKQ